MIYNIIRFKFFVQEIRQLCSYLVDLKRASAEEMRRSVYANYPAFIRWVPLSDINMYLQLTKS